MNVIDYYQFLTVRDFDVRRLVFLDESHVNDRTRYRLYGRSIRGVRPTFQYAMVRGQRYTVSVAANYRGIVDYMIINGSCDGHLFFEWFITSLYAAMEHDAILVMDNAPIHHYQPFLVLAEYLDVKIIYLPPYCPFLNPVEHIFAAIKMAVRRFRREIELEPVATLAMIAEGLRRYNVLGLLKRMGYHHVCKFPQ